MLGESNEKLSVKNIFTRVCIECDGENIEYVEKPDTVEIRGEEIQVMAKYWLCRDCGADWEFSDEGEYDQLDEAFRIYRNRHGMLQPEKINELRKRMGFTQGELAKIFGWGAVTISRYENGSLQSKSHDELLKLLERPETFYQFIKEKNNLENKDKYLQHIEQTLNLEKELPVSFLENLLSGKPDEFNGFQEVNIDKIKNLILFFCKDDGIYITKLNKLLFFTDFKYFKEYTHSISGMRYKHLPYGPVPEYYRSILELLVKTGELEVEYKDFGDYIGELYKSVEITDLSVFSDAELEILLEVKKKFAKSGSKEISEISHQEKAYRETKENQLISYFHAQELQI